VKHFLKDDADLTTLQKFYKVSVDWEGCNYYGLTIDWNYNAGHVDISMPGYVSKVDYTNPGTPHNCQA
jgi:hypothetical protein